MHHHQPALPEDQVISRQEGSTRTVHCDNSKKIKDKGTADVGCITINQQLKIGTKNYYCTGGWSKMNEQVPAFGHCAS
jgi:hypothetical protein